MRAHGIISIDGSAAEWLTGFGANGCANLPATNSAARYSTDDGCVTTNTDGGEYIWTDAVGDQRTDHWNFTGNMDLTEFRVTADNTNLYALLRFSDITDCNAQYIQIPVSVSSAGGLEALPDGMETNLSASFGGWDAVIEANTSATGIWTDAATYTAGGESFCSAANDVWEISMPLASLGTSYPVINRLNMAVVVACNAAGTPCENDGNSDAMDVITTVAGNTWNEVSDGTLDYSFVPNALDTCVPYATPYILTGANDTELVTNLRVAIECANLLPDENEIDLNGQTVSFTDAYADYNGATALPQITSHITIHNGTITRSSAEQFRFLNVGAAGLLTLFEMTVTNGYAGNLTNGGAVYNDGGELIIFHSTLSNNVAELDGGAVFTFGGTMAVLDSVLTGNSALSSNGGVGGALNNSDSVLAVYNSLLSGNKSAQGGAIYNNSLAGFHLNNVTVAGNHAGAEGGGIYNNSGGAHLFNTIVYGNEAELADPEISGNITNNVKSLVGVDPSFVNLVDASDNAPTTLGDYRLKDFSAAIDAGANDVLEDGFPEDLDGNPRFYDDANVADTGIGTPPIVDIGAYEKQTDSIPPAVVFTGVDTITALLENTGNSDTYTVALATTPSADVNITIDPDADCEVSIDGGATYAEVRTITTSTTAATNVVVRAFDDLILEQDQPCTVSYTISSADPDYNVLTRANDVYATVVDNEALNYGISAPGFVTPQSGSESVTPVSMMIFGSLNGTGTGARSIETSFDVAYSVSGGTATGGGVDYTLASGTVTFGPATPFSFSNAVNLISIAIEDDAIDESNETIIVAVGTDETGTSGTYDSRISLAPVAQYQSHTYTINDNDTASVTITESGGTTGVTEGSATADTYTVKLNTEPMQTVTLNIAFDAAQLIVNGDSDGSTTLTFDSNNWETAQEVTVVAVDDTLIELNPHTALITQTFTTADSAYSAIEPADVTVSITENDAAIVEFSDAEGNPFTTASEGFVGFPTVVLSLIVNGVPSAGFLADNIDVNLTYTHGTTEDADFSVMSSGVRFDRFSGNGSFDNFSIQLTDDLAVEANETVTLGLTIDSGNATVGAPITFTIVDNDSVNVTFAASDSTASEGTATHTIGATLAITATGDTGTPNLEDAAIIALSSTGGTATNGTDYSLAASTFSFPAGALNGASASADVAIENDNLVEANDETAILGFGTVTAVAADFATSGTHEVTIDENDFATVAFAENNDGVDENIGVFNKNVTLIITSNPSGGSLAADLNIPYGADELNALEPEDYTLVGSTISFPEGSTGGSIAAQVNIVDDDIDEDDEFFEPHLNNNVLAFATNITLTRALTTVVITDNDTADILVTPTTVAVDETGPTSMDYVVVLATEPVADVTVNMTFDAAQVSVEGETDGTYSITFTPDDWDTERFITVEAVDDALVEGDHSTTIVQTVSSPGDAKYNVINPADVLVNITDNDVPGVNVTQSGGSTDVEEGGALDLYSVVLNSVPTDTVTVTLTYDTQIQLSTDGVTFIDSPITLNFNPGNWNVSRTLIVMAVEDVVAEGTHSSLITQTTTSVNDALYNNIATEDVLVNIADNDVSTVSINSVIQDETNAGTTTFDFTVSLSNPSAFPISVDVATADNTATTADGDYAANTTTLNFAAGETFKMFSVTVNGDTTLENNEIFFVNLSNATGASINTTQTTGTISNDDTAPTLSILDASASEGNSGTTTFSFTVSLSNASAITTITVDAATADDTANSLDYTANTGTLSFAPMETIKTFDVMVNGDTAVEPDETFFVNLTNAANATLSDAQAVGTILNDDGAAELLLNGGFEEPGATGRDAKSWKGLYLSVTNDRRLCNTATRTVAFEGNCAFRFRFTGTIINTANPRSIRQIIIPSNVQATDMLTISAQVRAQSLVNRGRILIEAVYGTTRQKMAIQIGAGTYAYTLKTNSMTLTGTPTKIIVWVQPRQTTGTFFVDGLSLIHTPLAGARNAAPVEGNGDGFDIPLPSAPGN